MGTKKSRANKNKKNPNSGPNFTNSGPNFTNSGPNFTNSGTTFYQFWYHILPILVQIYQLLPNSGPKKKCTI